MKGEQANMAIVGEFQLRLDALCKEADSKGVILTVDVVALQPLAMGNQAMHPLARAKWFNQ